MAPERRMIFQRLRQMARIEPSREATDRAVAHARARLIGLADEPAQRSSYSVTQTAWNRRKRMFSRFTAIVAGSAALVALIIVLSFSSSPTQVAFAQVIQNVQKTQSLSMTINREGFPKIFEQRMIILPNGMMRTDFVDKYLVYNLKTRKLMMVNKKSKTAQIIEGFVPPYPAKFNLYEMFRNIVQKDNAQRLPEEVIDGRKAAVFMVEYKMPPTDEKVSIKVWVDPQTELPFRMEITGEVAKGKENKSVMSDMTFDQPVDPALFSFTPPEGYSVKTTGTAHLPEAPKEPELSAPEIIPGVGLGPVRFGMSREEIEKHFGKPDRYEANKSCMIYHSRGFVLFVNPRRGLVNIHCLSQTRTMVKVRPFAGKTKEGIGIGSSLEDIEKAFGKPNRDEGHDSTNPRLIYAKQGLDIDLFRDKVIGIFMRRVQTSP
ncbi:MAG: hypothetical protein JXB10_03335 [Pirellulales bacterium]|nr:hypothetical protein [Pirellulales bacterium]